MSVPSPEILMDQALFVCGIEDANKVEVPKIMEYLDEAGYRIVRKPENRPKLTDGDVRLMKRMYRGGYTVTELARIFDVHHATVSRTLKGVYH